MYIIFCAFGKFITKAVVYFPFSGKVHVKEWLLFCKRMTVILSDRLTQFDRNELCWPATVKDLWHWVRSGWGGDASHIPVSYGQCCSMPWKTGGWGGRELQSNFPTPDHQNIFNLILIWRCGFWFFENIWGGGGGMGPPAPMGATAMIVDNK